MKRKTNHQRTNCNLYQAVHQCKAIPKPVTFCGWIDHVRVPPHAPPTPAYEGHENVYNSYSWKRAPIKHHEIRLFDLITPIGQAIESIIGKLSVCLSLLSSENEFQIVETVKLDVKMWRKYILLNWMKCCSLTNCSDWNSETCSHYPMMFICDASFFTIALQLVTIVHILHHLRQMLFSLTTSTVPWHENST